MGDLLNGRDRNLKNSSGDSKKKDQPLSKRQELNNHIVCMRNGVRQARVQIINRLVSQLKRYKNRKGSPKEQEKAKRKADKFFEEIQILKKIKKDKVSLFALQDTQQLDAVLSNPESSPEEKVLARLSHHNVIVRDVKKYRDANPNWDKQIPVLLEMTREKRRKKKEKLNPEDNTFALPLKNDLKKKAKIEVNENDNDNGTVDGLESESVDFEEDDDKQEDVSEVCDSDLDEEKDDDEVQQTIVDKSIPVGRTNKNVKPNVIKTSVSSTKQTISPSPAPLLNKSEGTVKVKFLADLNDLEDDNLEDATDKKVVDITQAPKLKKPKSAFFVGGVDEPADKRVDDFKPKPFQKSAAFNQDHHNGNSKPVFRKGKLVSKPPPGNRLQSNFRQNRKGEAPFRQSGADNRFGGNAEPLGLKKARFSGDYQEDLLLKPSQRVETTSAEKLHPSWEAKKKQQQISLTEFKGKKIVFDDDD